MCAAVLEHAPDAGAPLAARRGARPHCGVASTRMASVYQVRLQRRGVQGERNLVFPHDQGSHGEAIAGRPLTVRLGGLQHKEPFLGYNPKSGPSETKPVLSRNSIVARPASV